MPVWAQRLLIIAGILVALWLVIYVALRTPPVQRWLTGLISEQLSKQLNTKVSLDGFDIDLFDEVELNGVYIEDQQQDTLLYVQKFRVNITPSALFNKTIYVKLIEVNGLYANLYQPEGQQDLNFAFIPEAFASEDSVSQPQDTTASAWNVDLYRVLLSDIRLDYDADSTEMHMALRKLSMLFDKLGLEDNHIQADQLDVDELRFAMLMPATVSDTTLIDTVATDTTAEDVLNPSGFAYSLNELTIDNSQIVYRVKRADTITSRQLDFENLTLNDLQTSVEDIEVGKNDLSLHLQNLGFTEGNSGFTLNKLEALAKVDMPHVQGELIALETAHSRLNGNMDVSLTLAEDTKTLMNSLKFDSELDQAVLSMADAAYFTDALDSLPDARKLAPQLTWQVHVADGQGQVNNLLLNVEDQVNLQAEMSFKDLGAIDSTSNASPYFKLNLQELRADLAFIRQFTDDSLDQYLRQTGSDQISLTAEAKGYLNDLNASAKVRSGLGTLATQASYRQGGEIADVKAQLMGERLNIRQVMKMLGNPDSVANAYNQLTFHTTADARIRMSAKDTTVSRADVRLVVDRFDYNKHTYKNLTLQSLLKDDSLQAELAYQDSLIEMHANAQALLAETPSYRLNMQLKDANLYRLQLASDSIIIANSRIQAVGKGSSADDIVGYLKISDLDVIKDANVYHMDSLMVSADKEGDLRAFTLQGDLMNAKMAGQFDLTHLPAAIEDFQQYYLASYQEAIEQTDTIKTNDGKYQQFDFTFSMDSTPALVRAFVPELQIPAPLRVEGSFNSQNKSLQLDVEVPRLVYGENIVDSLSLEAKTTKKAIAMALNIGNTQAAGLSIPDISLTGSLSGMADETASTSRKKLSTTQLDFNLKLALPEEPYRLDLDAVLQSRQDTITVALNESELVLEDQFWKFSKDARLVYASNYLDINDFSISQNGQEIFVTTDNSSGDSDLKLVIEQLAIGPFMDALDLEDYGVHGTLQGQATIREMFKPGSIAAKLAINNLEIKEQQIGDFKLNATKGSSESAETDLLNLLLTLQGVNNDLQIEGQYNLAAEKDNLNLQVDLNKFQLAPWQVFAEDYIKDLQGALKANLNVTGIPSDPVLRGNLAIADRVLLQPTISGATYYLKEQQIDFQGKTMRFNDFTVLDSAQTPAVLTGVVDYTNLTDPEINLKFTTNKFLAVNSEAYENPEFYGRAVATANVTMKGPVSNLVISGDLGVNEGTDMVISTVSGDEEVVQASFIEFIDRNAFLEADPLSADSVLTAAEKARADSVTVSGFTLDTKIHISPKAQFTILIDPVNGDKVVASGEADLEVLMKPNGDLNMQGVYTLNSGSYNLSFAGLVKKQFTIRDGSTIVWTGDPYNADMNLTAVYTAETDLSGLVAGFEDGLTDAQKKAVLTEQEANVLLKITGTLEEPELAFDLELPALASGGPEIQAVGEILNEIKQDETQLYKQVFGLIVLGRFIPATGGFGSGGQSDGSYAAVNDEINSSVSRLLSSQLSKLSEDYLGGVEINVGLESTEGVAQESALAGRDLGVELSKSLFDDRLTVTVGGTTSLGNDQGAASSSGSSTGEILGEFEVLYRLDKDGNLNIRIFQKTDRNALTNQREQRAGVSVYYQDSFNKLFSNDQVLRSKPLQEPEEDQDQSISSQGSTVSENTRKKKKTANKP